MKKSLLRILLSLSLTAGLAACSNSSDNKSTTTSAATVTYSATNGYCYASTGQVVDASYCTSTTGTSSTYYWNNGTCYAISNNQSVEQSYCAGLTYALYNGSCYVISTGQQVATSYCGTSTTSTTTAQACYGTYYYQSSYGWQQVYCNGANCRGYTLYSPTTNQNVTCQ